MGSAEAPGALTHAEILQQPDVWPDTLSRMRRAGDLLAAHRGPVVTGAGTSAYAALAVAAALPGARAVPSTDLLADVRPYFDEGSALVSLARSGNSPESVGAIERVRRSFPTVRHIAITCNAEGQLARTLGVTAVVLDPRTNDRSLAMTSSFSNLVLAGLCLGRSDEIAAALPRICARVKANLAALDAKAQVIAAGGATRMVVLAAAPTMGWAQETSLKILEMSAGAIPVLAETHLGLRHGPMSFLRPDTLVLSLLSSDPLARRYEEDLLSELRAKKLGSIIGIAADDARPELYDASVPAMAPELADSLRTPFEIVFPQLLAYHLSLAAGLNPDSPSPGGVITRVVQGVRIYEE
jgi:tagatose-6-phosphate ketose/aldose isomerase